MEKKGIWILIDAEGKNLPWRFQSENKARDFKFLMGRPNWKIRQL